MQQQITRGDYLEDLITIYIENNLQQSLEDMYSMFVFQCGEIQKQLTPAPVIKISFTEAESKLFTNYNTCYLAGITTDGHKETFNGSISFNTRGEVVYYEPTPNGSLQASTTSTIACPCTGISGVFANCTQPAIKAYFSINYVPTKLSELQNDTDFQDGVDVAESISEHNASESAHPYIQSSLASATEALEIKIGEEETARKEQVSLAIQTTEAYTDSVVTQATEATKAYADSIVSTATTATEAYTDSLVQSATTAINTTIGEEVLARQGADNNLQGQIDALAAASDVTDIVGTYAELQSYDTQHLNNNDIIKVLSDETHDDEPSYYRFNKIADTFSYIGSESAAYTKAQSNSIFVAQTTTVNGKALSSDITLTYSDVSALPATTQTVIDAHTSAIAANTTAIASNTSTLASHTTAIATNTSAISTINGKIPTDASTTNKLVSASTLSASIADFANQDLSNLTSNGEARLHALKAYADEGELLTDADGLSFVRNYAHSTFDRSKFTVVGSPTITDDGIASGFSGSNYLTKSNIDFASANSWKIITPIHHVTNSAANAVYQITNGGYSNSLYINASSYIKFNAQVGASTTLAFGSQNNATGYNAIALVSGNDYIHIMEFTGTQYIFNLYKDGSLIYSDTKDSTNKLYPNTSNGINIGTSSYDGSMATGSIDLKQFSITVDGVEVFSGNKTGIDTIKPDDYTVVGSPTISADGIASGFSSSNYLYTQQDFTSDFKLESKVKLGVLSGLNRPIAFLCDDNSSPSTQNWIALFYQNPSKKIVVRVMVNGTETNVLTNNTYEENDILDVGFTYKNGVFTVYAGSDAQTLTLDASSLVSALKYIRIGYDTSGVFANPFTGSIDINAFKIYVDGDLVYQPCLKIPYTESKTGSKIVDSIYRDRVNDMAEQFGYANYYTLSDTDFTLPQVELYGLIGAKTLRDSYENGINKWYLYSNRDLEQQGSCTSGVEVTLAKPFADTNYVLSVPYSAKSTTAFTPTQTGDWIAKGKGLL